MTQFIEELPPDQFPQDRADNADKTKNSISSSDIRAQCQLFDDASTNLAQIYNNKFASTVDATGMRRWESDWFPTPVDASIPFDQRQARLFAKIRANGGISLPAIRNILTPYFANVGLAFDIAAWSGANGGAWILGESLLGVDTILALLDPIIGAAEPNPLDCDLDYAAAGLTLQQLQDIQTTAYTYEVRIFGHATDDFIAIIDDVLTQYEPARSTHVILNDYPVPL